MFCLAHSPINFLCIFGSISEMKCLPDGISINQGTQIAIQIILSYKLMLIYLYISITLYTVHHPTSSLLQLPSIFIWQPVFKPLLKLLALVSSICYRQLDTN